MRVALPGHDGEKVDWLDVLRRDGVEAVRAGIEDAEVFSPTEAELEALQQNQSEASGLKKVEEEYPLPKMDTLHLQYARTRAGEVKVHKLVPRPGQPPLLVPVATPFGVPARLRRADQQDAYGLRAVVQDMDGRSREVDFDRSELARLGASDILSRLYAAGLRTEADGEKIAVQSLKAAAPQHEIVIYDRPGWHEIAGTRDLVFICPGGEVIGAPAGLDVELSASTRLSPDVAVAGTFEDWREAVGAALSVSGCPHWVLGVVAAFAGPLIALTGLDTCGINLSGQSSSGKSTAQGLAVSAWSTPDIIRGGLAQSARATDNATEALAGRATGTILSMDELALASSKTVGKLIYMIASGSGKRRMRADAMLRPSYTWSTFAIFSAERSLEETVRADDGEWRAGMAVRFADIDVTEVNRQVDAATLRLIRQIEQHHGHAGPAFVRAMISRDLHRQTEELKSRILAVSRQLAGADADSAIVRSAMPFAVLLTAGELAKALGIIPSHAEVDEAVLWAWERFSHSPDSDVLSPEDHAIEKLRQFIAERWGITIKNVEGDSGYREAIGWYDKDAVYIPKDRIVEATGSFLKKTDIGLLLKRNNLLIKHETDRFTYPYVPKVGHVTCYVLKRSAVGRHNEEEKEETDRLLTVIAGGRR